MANTVVKSEALLTAAIDFGTTYSGYAYAFKADLQTEHPSISTNTWHGGKTISSKAPTAVLFDSMKKMIAFGYEAETKYSEICADELHDQYYFFHRFKMMLHKSRSLKTSTKLKEEGGKEMPAVDVFAGTIQYLKTHLMDELRRRVTEIHESDIQWVLTVPAIWDNDAKQFMRQAAEKGGIAHDQLKIALEPEAASVYCQRLATERRTREDGTSLSISDPNSKFMVLDLGGGTADITVQERMPDGSLREVHYATGGAWGGTKVDEEYIKLLHEIAGGDEKGEEVMTKFKKISMEDSVELRREFEIKKRNAKTDGDAKTVIRLPVSLKDVFLEVTEKTMDVSVGNTHYGNLITVKSDKMKLENDVLKALFKPALDSIIAHVRDLFKEENVKDVDTVLLVGGFSGSELINTTLRNEFPSKKFFTPNEPDLAVVIGAVLYGFDPGVITSRVSRKTYGVRGKTAFKTDKHPGGKKEVIDGREWCCDIFFKLIAIGQTVDVGNKCHGQTFTPTEKNQKQMCIPIFSSTSINPGYTTDVGCEYLGKVIVDMPDTTGDYSREVDILFKFGGTELEVEGLEKRLMKTFKTSVNFLGGVS